MIALSLEVNRVVVGDPAGLDVTQRRVQIVPGSQLPVSLVGAGGLDPQRGISPGQKLALQIGAGWLDRGGPGDPQALHQPLLGSAKAALDAALGLR